MPHAVHTRHLGRSKSWRKATMRSLAQALLKRERIKTTWAKAKETQRLTERLITMGKQASLSARRRAQGILNDAEGVRKLFAEIAPRFQNRSGGYTRILHDGNRSGDGAAMAWIELVELSPKITEKPKLKPSKEEKPVPPTPIKEKPVTKERPAKEEPQKKPVKFIDGLRKLFKRRDNP